MGDGPKAVGLNPPPRNYRTEKFNFGASTLQIYNTLTKGSPGTSMAAFDFLPEEDRMALAHYVRTLVSNPPDDPQELVDVLPVVTGGEPSAAAAPAGAATADSAARDTAATGAPAAAARPEIPLDLAVSRLIAASSSPQVPAAGTVLTGPYALYCTSCHGARGEGSVTARSFLPTGTVYAQTRPLSVIDRRLLESLQSFTAFLSAGMPGVEGHRFAELTAVQTETIYEALKAIQKDGKQTEPKL